MNLPCLNSKRSAIASYRGHLAFCGQWIWELSICECFVCMFTWWLQAHERAEIRGRGLRWGKSSLWNRVRWQLIYRLWHVDGLRVQHRRRPHCHFPTSSLCSICGLLWGLSYETLCVSAVERAQETQDSSAKQVHACECVLKSVQFHHERLAQPHSHVDRYTESQPWGSQDYRSESDTWRCAMDWMN